MRRIIFVDDEPNVLKALQRMLRPMRKEWEMAFASSGQEALDQMAESPFDVVVTDMRMPGMDGAALLTEVREQYPDMVRFVLSGQSDQETIFRSVGPTHQFMAKPCEPEVLKNTVDRAFKLRDLLNDDALKSLVSQLTTLPAMPHIYERLVKELQSPDASIATIGRIIEADVGMTAKILQWVNSAFFGIRRHVSNPTQAASLLGLDTVRSLVLMVGVFSQTPGASLPPRFSLDALWHHSMVCGAYAQAIGKCEGMKDKETSEAFTAGLLHDAGKLALVWNGPDEYKAVLARVDEGRQTVVQAEQEVFGATHAQVGAYMLGLWGLPDPIVEAVAFHHNPDECPGVTFAPLTAVHAANCLVHEDHGQEEGIAVEQLSETYLDRLGLGDRLEAWREVCSQIGQEEED